MFYVFLIIFTLTLSVVRAPSSVGTAFEDEGGNVPGAHPDIVRIIDVPGRNPGGVSWHDSYSVGNQCYMSSNFDHDIGDVRVDTPVGQ